MRFYTQFHRKSAMFKFSIFTTLLILLFPLCAISQVNYTTDFSSMTDWTGSGFGTTTTDPCNGTSVRENVYSTATLEGDLHRSATLGTSLGGEMTVTFDYKVIDYSGGGATPASSFTMVVQSGTSASGPWTTEYTVVHTASTACATKSFTYTPPAGSNVYLKFRTDWIAGDFWVYYDDLSVVESLCTAPIATTTLVPDCVNGEFSVDLMVSSIGDGTGVDITSTPPSNDSDSETNVGTGTYTFGPYTANTPVTFLVDGTPYGGCDFTTASVNELCECSTLPAATVNTTNLNCTSADYDIEVTVTGFGDGTAADIEIDGVVVQANAVLSNLYTFTGYATGTHTVTIVATGGAFVTCETDYMVTESCNGGETCSDAVNILGTTSSCDLTTATKDAPAALLNCFENVGNNTLGMGTCSGESCAEHSAYYYTDYKDIWYVINLPAGTDEFSVHFTGLTCAVGVFPYSSTCGSLNLLNVGTAGSGGLADSDNDGTIEVEAGDRPFINTDGVIHFKGGDVLTATNAGSAIYLRVFAHDDLAAGSACNDADIVKCAFQIGVTAPQPNDVCNDGLNINSFDDDVTNDPDSFLPVTQSGDISQANADPDTHDEVNGETCNGITFNTGEEDLWYALSTPDNGSNYYVDIAIDFTGTADEIYVLLHNYCSNGDIDPIGCASISADGIVSFDASNITNFDNALTPNNDYNIRIVKPTGSTATTFDISANLIAENNTCSIMQETFPGFDLPPTGVLGAEVNMNFASDSGSDPVTAGRDLWFQFDPLTTTDGFGFTTASTTAELTVGGLDAGEELTLLLYKGNTVSSNNCNDLAGDYLESLTVTADGIVELSCLDELHTSVDGGYIVRVVQTAGGTIVDNATINADPQPAGPMNNDCENIWNGGPTNLGWTDPSPGPSDGVNDGGPAVNYNPYVIELGFENYLSGDFENSTDCHPNISSALCNGVDHQAINANEDRDLWYIVTVPDFVGSCDLTMSETISSVTFLYNAGSQFEDAILYLYDGCSDSNLIGCSGVLDGAPSGAGDAQFDDPQSTWTVSDLVQGNSYLLRIKPDDNSSSGVFNEFDFDISWKTADPSPCNDDPANAEALSVGCFSYSNLETWSAQGATETTPVDGAPETDVWFSFTAPTGNGGSYTTGKSWVSVFFENVSGHALSLDIYNTPSTDPSGKTWETGGSAGDQAWGVFGNLNEGQTYYLRLYHKEASTVNVEYKIAVNDGPGISPGWSCGSNSQSMISQCASGCVDLRETFYKIDLPVDAPTNAYWAIEVTGMDQDLDFELRSQYNNGQTTYVVGTTGVDGALEGGAMDYDHPCSSVVLESEVTISSTTTGINGCDGNDTLGDIDPDNDASSETANSAIGSGVRRVYHDMNGPGSASMKDYYFVRVFIDPSDPRYAEWAEVKICDISFKGPYSTAALADAGGVPDLNCDPVTCSISNLAVTAENTCDGNNATFSLSFDATDGSGDYQIVATADNTDLGITTGDILGTVTGVGNGIGLLIDGTVSGPTIASSISVDIQDSNETSCEGGTPVTVMIAACPNTTIGVQDYIHTSEGTAVTGNVLNNDYDPQGDPQTVNTTPVTGPTNGMLVLNGDGSYTYTPTAGSTGEDSFVYQVCDDIVPPACEDVTVYIEIIPDPTIANNPPIANPDYGLTEVDTPISGSLISNDSDPDGQNLIINTTPTTTPSNGTLTINPDGTYDYTPNGGFVGTDTFEYEVCDDGSPSLCDVTTVTIDVVPDNGNTTGASDDSGIGLMDEVISGDLVANDFDPEGDDQTINTIPTANPTNGTVTINADGTYEYTPTTGFVGNDVFRYEICDNGSPMVCDEATVYITVLPEKPNTTLAVNDYNHTVQDVAVSGDVSINDYDAESETQTVNTTPVTNPANGSVVLNSDGTYTYTPTAGFFGEDSFEYETCDSHSPMACDIATVYIEVIPSPTLGNDGPIANPDYGQTEVNTPISGSLIANDSDPDGDPLTVTITPIVTPAVGTLIINSDGTYNYTPPTDFIGSVTFDYEICDNGTPPLCDITTVVIDVLPNDGNFTSAFDDSGIGPVNENIVGNVSTNDFDPEGDNQFVNSTPVVGPTNGTVTLASDGSYIYVPNEDFVGNDQFVYETCDDGSPQECTMATVYITILAPPATPEYTPQFVIDGTSFTVGQTRDGIYVIDNIGLGDSEGQIVFTITLPGTSAFTSTVSGAMTTANVFGGIPVNNADWNFTQVGSQVVCQLKAGKKILKGSQSLIGLSFEAVGIVGSTGGTTAQIQSFTAFDVIELNNFAQGQFIIN